MDTNTKPLFFDRIEDALAEVINRCGGRKKFAGEMWPSKPQRDAHNLVDACLNPERREKFSPQDVQYILKRGREAECHDAIYYICGEAGYDQPRPVNPQDKREQLQRDFIRSVEVQARILDELKGMEQGNVRNIRG